jgi:polysaccharide biosynthesis transport protein
MSDLDGGDFGGVRSEVGGWLRSETEENDLRRYLTTLRERRGLILLCVLVATLVAVAYVVLAKPVYQAQANVVVLPVNLNGNDALTGLPLVVASADPTVDVQTAAELVRTTGAAAATKVVLHLGDTPQQILARVSVIPVAGSSVVAVTATASTAGAAAQLANTFAGSAIAERTAAFYKQLDQQIAGLKQQIAVSSPAVATQLSVQVTELETLRAGPLPDMRIATLAAPPGAPASPRKKLSIAAGLVGGLVIGVIAAFVLQAVDPRLRREEQLRRLFRLPILARIPRDGPARGGPRRPAALGPVSLEAYRTLRATLLASRPGGPPGSILVTGGQDDDGDQSRFLAGLVGGQCDPDRGRYPPAVCRSGAWLGV